MHPFKISDHLQNILKRLAKKDKHLYDQILKKIEEVVQCSSIDHYKNLRYTMKDSKRVHVGHFVLVFQYNKNTHEVYFDDFDHHDNIYRR